MYLEIQKDENFQPDCSFMISKPFQREVFLF